MQDLRGTRASACLDALRALAALVVFGGHLRQNLFVDWEASPRESLVDKLFFFTTGFGHEAVMVFFVLSGYLVGGSVLRLHQEGRWSWPAFLVARLSRLWIVLLPALAAGRRAGRARASPRRVALAGASPRSRRGSRRPPGWATCSSSRRSSVPPFGSNGPLWSLSYELWYYLACPFVVAAATSRNRWSRALHGLAAAGILAFTGPRIAVYFSIWLMGLCAFMAPRLSLARGRTLAAASLLALLPVAVWLGTRDGYRGTFGARLRRGAAGGGAARRAPGRGAARARAWRLGSRGGSPAGRTPSTSCTCPCWCW